MRASWALVLLILFGPSVGAQIPSVAPWRTATPAEKELDAAAFAGLQEGIAQNLPDVSSVVVAWRGRVVFTFHRDGSPDALRDTRSAAKSALSALFGVALGQGRIASLDQPVLALMPEWAALNPDPRAANITVRHLLSMTAGFETDDPTGTAPAGRPQEGWARRLRHAPGESFAYDNALIPMISSVLEKATGMPLADYARQQLVQPLGLAEPSYRAGLHMRTEDMAKLGQLFLQNGTWGGEQIIPEAFVLAATRVQSRGGPPVSLPYGHLWWVVPSETPRPTFFASGYAGQFIWVHPPLELVIAATSIVSAESQQRGQALRLIRGRLFNAVLDRNKAQPR